jgi:hypothetical protein
VRITPDIGRRRPSFSPLVAAAALSLFGFLLLGLAGARPATAADATMSPFVPGRHVYDYGNVLSAQLATAAETMAAHIEAAGGGRVVIYTAETSAQLPDTGTLARDWQVDGMLLDGQGANYGNLAVGDTLKGKLTTAQLGTVGSSPGPQDVEGWMMSALARVDAFLSGTHVFDGAAALDAGGKARAEAAAKDLSAKLGAPVYIDISLGGDDPSTAAFFNGADLASSLRDSLVISLSVAGTEYAGYLQTINSKVIGEHHTGAPWTATTTLENTAVTGADVQASLLSAIGAVQSGSVASAGSSGGLGLEFWFWLIFAIAMIGIGVGSPFYGGWLIRKMTGTTGPIKGGLPGDAIIETITDTGTTVTMASVGPEAPEYKFGLEVTPAAGGAPYQVEVKALVPRLYILMVVPGAHVGVLIDPANQQKVSIDFSSIGSGSTGGAAAGATPLGGFSMDFDATGQPAAADVAALATGVRSGSVNQIKGSADQLLATGTHGTAVITTAQPLGKTVRDINPGADPSRLNDPMWLFTVEVSLAGEAPYPAVFGHRVPLARVASVFPGAKLAVAVGAEDKNEVAIDWEKSPIGA